jgi:hypothetical protein
MSEKWKCRICSLINEGSDDCAYCGACRYKCTCPVVESGAIGLVTLVRASADCQVPMHREAAQSQIEEA